MRSPLCLHEGGAFGAGEILQLNEIIAKNNNTVLVKYLKLRLDWGEFVYERLR